MLILAMIDRHLHNHKYLAKISCTLFVFVYLVGLLSRPRIPFLVQPIPNNEERLLGIGPGSSVARSHLSTYDILRSLLYHTIISCPQFNFHTHNYMFYCGLKAVFLALTNGGNKRYPIALCASLFYFFSFIIFTASRLSSFYSLPIIGSPHTTYLPRRLLRHAHEAFGARVYTPRAGLCEQGGAYWRY